MRAPRGIPARRIFLEAVAALVPADGRARVLAEHLHRVARSVIRNTKAVRLPTTFGINLALVSMDVVDSA
jgi:hypothetical protein